jgi:hypothetical protein
MKKWVALCAVLVAMVIVSPSQAGEPDGQIDGGALAGLGLSGMQQMSDDEGTQVRGRFARVSGWSSASVFGGASSFNSYAAGGRRIAAGGSVSFASRSVTNSFGFFSTNRTVVVASGGGAIAFGR